MNQTKATIDHEEIQRWAEARKAVPSRVKRTGGRGDVGMIRLDFPGYSGKDSLEAISWDDFFDKFEESQLALVYRESLARGGTSNFNKLVGRETVDLAQHSGRRAGLPRRRAKEQARAAGSARGGTAARPPARRRAQVSQEPAEPPRGRKRTTKAAATRTARKSPSKRTTTGRPAKRTAKRSAPRKTTGTRARA